MKAVIDASVLRNVLKHLAMTKSKYVSFIVRNNALWAYSKDSLFIMQKVPCEVEGQGEFTVSFDVLQKVIKGKTIIQMSYSDNSVTISTKESNYKYSAQLTTVNHVPLEMPEKKEMLPFSKEMINIIIKSYPLLKIKNRFNSPMPFHINIQEGRATIALYDNYHLASVQCGLDHPNISLTLDNQLLETLYPLINESTKLYLDNNQFIARSKNFVMQMATSQIQAKPIDFIYNLPPVTFELDANALRSVVNNMEGSIIFSKDKSKLKLSNTTETGRVTSWLQLDNMNWSNDMTVGIWSELLTDILILLKGKMLRFHLTPNLLYISFEEENCKYVYVCATYNNKN